MRRNIVAGTEGVYDLIFCSSYVLLHNYYVDAKEVRSLETKVVSDLFEKLFVNVDQLGNRDTPLC